MIVNGKKILVIDDNNTIRGLVSQMLCRLGYEVSLAISDENGLSLFLRNQFDLVITDFEMSGMDSINLAYCIKEKSPSTKVVLMTGNEKEVILARIKDSAVDRALIKPFNLVDIDETIQTLLYH